MKITDEQYDFYSKDKTWIWNLTVFFFACQNISLLNSNTLCLSFTDLIFIAPDFNVQSLQKELVHTRLLTNICFYILFVILF